MEQAALTRAGFLREASAIGFIQFPFPRRQGLVWYAERLNKEAGEGQGLMPLPEELHVTHVTAFGI